MRKGIIYVYFNRAKYEKEGIERYYVGQTVRTMEQRARKDGIGYGWQDEKCQTKFARAIRKWGWEAFEGRVLEEVYEEDLNELEKFYIKEFDSYKHGYNDTFGGEGTRGFNAFANKTEEEMKEYSKKQSESQRKRFEDPEEIEKLSKAQKKRYEDPKEIEKQSKTMKKHYEDKEARQKTGIAVKKYYEDPKAREKTSKAQKKRWENKEEREKQSKAIKKRFEDPKERKKCGHPGEKHSQTKSVYCKELNIVFSYIGLAEKYCINVLNSKIGPISGVCDGNRKSTGKLADGTKLHWNWLEDVDKETLDKAEYIDSKKYEEILSQNVNVCNK